MLEREEKKASVPPVLTNKLVIGQILQDREITKVVASGAKSKTVWTDFLVIRIVEFIGSDLAGAVATFGLLVVALEVILVCQRCCRECRAYNENNDVLFFRVSRG